MKNQNKHFSNLGNITRGNDFTTVTPFYDTGWVRTYTNYRIYEMPEVHVTVNKHRQRLINDQVFIKNGSDFELELFNKETETVYVGITIEGKEEGSKLILRAGERVFVERYIEDNKKLNFSTYNVDENNKEVDKAIAKNGLIELHFYVEDKPDWNNYNWVNTGPWDSTTYTANTMNIQCNTTTDFDGSCTTDTVGMASNTMSGLDSLDDTDRSMMNRAVKGSRKLSAQKETGKIEKGDISDQHFNKKFLDINLFYIGMQTIKLLPESERQAIKHYCTACGVKQRKSSWSFCPSCGKAY